MNQGSLHNDEELAKADRIAYLVAGHLSNSLTAEEEQELNDWIVESDENLELFEKLTDEENIELALQAHRSREADKRAAFDTVRKKIAAGRRSWLRRLGPYLVAASLLVIAVYSYLLIANDKTRNNEKPAATAATNDRPPGGDKAVLTLSDGRTLILDAAARGVLAEDKGTKVMAPAAGLLAYGPGSANAEQHTLSTPRGGQYRVVLPDGTKVWLNAASSLRFPLVFGGASRSVELKGEAYFEVAKDGAHPFIVATTTPSGIRGEVTVLGTHFNINAYGDDALIKTTLLEGAVEVTTGALKKRLQPGEQALLSSDIRVVPADVNEEIAWKEGKFLFRDATIRSIGEQLRRWYDVEVDYQGSINQHFNTELSRDVPLSRLLGILEKTKQVHFQLEENKLVIRP